jgi:hypothetical protein
MTTTAQPEVQLARVALAVYGARLGTASMQPRRCVQQAGSVEAVMDGLLLHDLGSSGRHRSLPAWSTTSASAAVRG